MNRILLVDDDKKFCTMLAQFLEEEGFSCMAVHDGITALDKATYADFDALILDIMMPKMNGFEVLRRLRKIKPVPILMLTARGGENDSIIGLEIGADDYLAKPCNPKVLAARLRAVLRRTENSPHPSKPLDTVTVGDVVIHPGSREVMVDNRLVELTNMEFKILDLLVRSAGQVVSKEDLSLKGLNRKLMPYDRSIDFHMSSLRRKLGPSAGDLQRILTIRGEGYLFSLPL